MILKQYYLGCLAHASYLLGDESSSTAIIVDPQRDIQQYLADAEKFGLQIRHVFLTHFHADFVAGHLELRDRCGATIARIRSASDHGRCAGSNQMAQVQGATIKAQCKTLRMPMIASQFGTLAEQAIREKKSHVGYLEALLLAEIEERERNTIERRIKEAHLPRVKTLEEFDYTQSPNVTAAKMRDLAEGGYIERAEPVLFIGECGTGKTHLLTGLCVAACRQKRRVRFTTAAGLVNELVEAQHQLQLRRVMARWSRYDLIAIDVQEGSYTCALLFLDYSQLNRSTFRGGVAKSRNARFQVSRIRAVLTSPNRCPHA